MKMMKIIRRFFETRNETAEEIEEAVWDDHRDWPEVSDDEEVFEDCDEEIEWVTDEEQSEPHASSRDNDEGNADHDRFAW